MTAGICVAGPDGTRIVSGEPPEGLDVSTLPEDGGLLVDGRVSVNPFRLADGEHAFLLVAADRPLAPEVHEALRTLVSQVFMSFNSLRLSAENQQRRQEAQFKRLIHNASDIILVADAGGVVSYASPSLERRLGWAAGDVVGGGFEVLLGEQEAADGLRMFTEVASTRSRSELICDWRLRHRDGGRSDYEVVVTDLLDDPLISGLVLTMRDVSERRELERQLSHQAFHDALTGLANRSLFQDRAEHALARTVRSGAQLGMVVLDLDEFKVVNDTRGHTVGDELLVAVSQRLVELLRPGDTVARFGGDEFGLLLEDLPDAGHITAVVERILGRLAEPFEIGGQRVSSGASAGVVVVGGDAGDRRAGAAAQRGPGAVRGQGRRPGPGGGLPRRAQRADAGPGRPHRPAAPGPGRGAVPAAVPADRAGRDRRADRGGGAGALAAPGGGPARAGRVHPAVRGQRADPRARQLGAAGGQPAAGGLVGVAAGAADVGERLGQAAGAPRVPGRGAGGDRRAPAPRGQLVLELTESVLVDDGTGEVAELLHRLHGFGAQLALDDFGTGYSSLGYLQRFPIDILKIDKSFVDNLVGQATTGGAVVRAVISLGHALRMQVVAEGIETAEQRDALLRLGCGLGQGYLFARPLPAERIQELLLASDRFGPPVGISLIASPVSGGS